MARPSPWPTLFSSSCGARTLATLVVETETDVALDAHLDVARLDDDEGEDVLVVARGVGEGARRRLVQDERCGTERRVDSYTRDCFST